MEWQGDLGYFAMSVKQRKKSDGRREKGMRGEEWEKGVREEERMREMEERRKGQGVK